MGQGKSSLPSFVIHGLTVTYRPGLVTLCVVSHIIELALQSFAIYLTLTRRLRQV